eukprot:COSAG01_NODE_5496_length_4225_cov_1.890936_3_plen_77_part_00
MPWQQPVDRNGRRTTCAMSCHERTVCLPGLSQAHTELLPASLTQVATGNALPLVLGPLLLNCHLFTTVLWYHICGT